MSILSPVLSDLFPTAKSLRPGDAITGIDGTVFEVPRTVRANDYATPVLRHIYFDGDTVGMTVAVDAPIDLVPPF